MSRALATIARRGGGAGRLRGLGGRITGARMASPAARDAPDPSAGRAPAVSGRRLHLGTALATLVSFAMFGIFFAMQVLPGGPRRGRDGQRAAAAAHDRGMVVGMIGGTRMARRKGTGDAGAGAPLANAKALVRSGYADGRDAGGGATPPSPAAPGSRRMVRRVRLGLGLAMPQTMNAALSPVRERSGSGSALIRRCAGRRHHRGRGARHRA